MREQDVVLKHQSHVALLSRHSHALRRVLQHLTGELDAAVNLDEPREGSKQRGLAGAVGPKHRDGLPCVDLQLDIERKAVAADLDPSLEAQSAPSHRSRMPTRIASETARRMRLRTIADSGRVSLAT